MPDPGPRLPGQRRPSDRSEPVLTLVLHEICAAARRDVVLTSSPDLQRVAAECAPDVAEAVWLLLEHADGHEGQQGAGPVRVAVDLTRSRVRVAVDDEGCAPGCATHSSQMDRVWSVGAASGDRRCHVGSGRRGGVRVEWSAPADDRRRDEPAAPRRELTSRA